MDNNKGNYKDRLLMRKGALVWVTFVLLVFSIEFSLQKIFLWETMSTAKEAIVECSSITDLQTSKYCFSSFIEKSNNRLLWNINSYIIAFSLILLFVSLQTIKRYHRAIKLKIKRYFNRKRGE